MANDAPARPNRGTAQLLRDVITAHRGTWFRVVPFLALVLLGLVAGLTVALATAGSAAENLMGALTGAGENTDVNLLLAAVRTMWLPLLVALVGGLIWLGVTIHFADGVVVDRRTRSSRAFGTVLRRSPGGALALLVFALTVLAAVAAAPALTVVGLVGLALTPAVRRWRPAARWPSLWTLAVLAVPFGLAFTLAVRWSTAMPEVWLTGRGTRRALRSSWERVRGHGLEAGVTIGLALAVTGLLSWGLRSLVLLAGTGAGTQVTSELVGPLLLGPLPIVAIVVLYRRFDPTTPTAATIAPRRPAPAVSPVVVLVTALVATLTSPVASHASAQGAGTQPVSIIVQWDPDPPPASTPVTVDVFVMPDGTEIPPTGQVTVTVDGAPVAGSPFTIPAVTSEVTLAPGERVIDVTYSGDEVFAPATRRVELTAVETTTTTLEVSETEITHGETLDLAAAVTAITVPTGTVEFEYRMPSTATFTTIATVPLDGSGRAALEVADPREGAWRARFPGTTTHGPSGSAEPYVHVLDAETSVGLTITPPSPSVPGDDLVAEATVTAPDSPATPTGSVVLRADGVDLATEALTDGAVDMNVALDPGQHQLEAAYLPDAGFASATSDPVPHEVVPWGADVTIVSSSPQTLANESFELTATVAAAAVATGDVEFVAFTDGVATTLATAPLVEDGGTATATVDVDSLAAGHHALVARYAGDGSVDPGASAAIGHDVLSRPTTIAVSDAPSEMEVGETAAVTVDVESGAFTPTGFVELLHGADVVDTGALHDGSTALEFTPDGAGTYNLTLVYDGDAAFASATGTHTVEVDRRETALSVVGGFDDRRDWTYGDAVTFTGQVTGVSGLDTPGGTVELVGDGVDEEALLGVDGSFSITTDRIPATTQRLWFEYSGDDIYAPIEAPEPIRTGITEAVAAAELSAIPRVPTMGEPITLTATFDGSGDVGAGVTGDVTFHLDTDGLTPVGSATIVDGTASITIDPVTDIGHTSNVLLVEAHYPGDGNFAAVETPPLRIDLRAAPSSTRTAVTVVDRSAWYYGEQVGVSVTVSGSTQDPPRGQVTLFAESTRDDGSRQRSGFGVITLTPLVDGASRGQWSGFVGGDGLAGHRQVTPQLGWPTDRIVAVYRPTGNHETSSGDVAFPAQRRASTTELLHDELTVNARRTFTVDVGVEPLPGAYDPPLTGRVTLTTADGTCSRFLASGTRIDCPFGFRTAGAHEIVVEYEGNAAVAPSTETFAVDVERGSVGLQVQPPGRLQDGAPIEVRWGYVVSSTGGHPTGDVEIRTGVGNRLLCRAAIEDRACSGTFDLSEEPAGDITVTAIYSGDDHFYPDTHATNVARAEGCYVLDVRASGDRDADDQPTRGGSVEVLTAPNCGNGEGYLANTDVRLRAVSDPGHHLTAWRVPDPADGSGWFSAWRGVTRLTRTVNDDPDSRILWAEFALRCHTVEPEVTGSGTLQDLGATQAGRCRTGPGYLHGSTIEFRPVPRDNWRTGEADIFYGFGDLPPGATARTDRFGRQRVEVEVVDDLRIPVTFGPRCRSLVTDGASGSASALTSTNCQSPDGDGYARNTSVTVEAEAAPAVLGDGAVFAGWRRDGEIDAELGQEPTTTVRIGEPDEVLIQPAYLLCDTVEVAVDAPEGFQRWIGRPDPTQDEFVVGGVEVAPAANCPDGSERWVRGTVVELTPRRASSDVEFVGWSEDGVLVSSARVADADMQISNARGADPVATATAAMDDQIRGFVDGQIAQLEWEVDYFGKQLQTEGADPDVVADLEAARADAQEALGQLGSGDGQVPRSTGLTSPRLTEFAATLAQLEALRDAVPGRWAQERQALERLETAREELEEGRRQAGDVDGDEAFELHYTRAAELEADIASARSALRRLAGEPGGLLSGISTADIDAFSGSWGGEATDGGVLAVRLDGPLTATAHFLLEDACSRLTVTPVGLRGGRDGAVDVTVPETGCGPDHYFDRAKHHAASGGRGEVPHTVLPPARITNGTVNRLVPEVLSGVPFAEERDNCFPVTCSETVAGDVEVRIHRCAALEPGVEIVIAGDPTGKVYYPPSFGTDVGEFAWIVGEGHFPRNVCNTPVPDNVTAANQLARGDRRGLLNPSVDWIAGAEITLLTVPPAAGFEFLGWGPVDDASRVVPTTHVQDGDGYNPLGIRVVAGATEPTVGAEVRYRAHCAELDLGVGVSIVEPKRQTCPGGHGYLVGTFVVVRAEWRDHHGDPYDGFRSGTVPGTESRDEATGEPTAVVLVDGPKSVAVRYPGDTDRALNAMAQAGKLAAGITALVVSAGIGLACAPCGVALAALAITQFVLPHIPGTAGLVGALDMLNPLSAVGCAGQWGLASGPSSGGPLSPEQMEAGGAAVKFAKMGVTAYGGGDAMAGAGPFGAAVAAASVIHGTVSAGVFTSDYEYQSQSDLRDTKGWSDCMAETYQ